MEPQQKILPLPASDLIETALDAHNAVGKAMQALHAPEWLLLDLSMAQLKVLLVLDAEQTLTIGQLARKMCLAKPTASILVDKLVQGAYIERAEDAADRRRTLIQLTAKGADLAVCLLRGRRTQMCTLLASLAANDLAALVQGLHALAQVAQEQLSKNADFSCTE